MSSRQHANTQPPTDIAVSLSLSLCLSVSVSVAVTSVVNTSRQDAHLQRPVTAAVTRHAPHALSHRPPTSLATRTAAVALPPAARYKLTLTHAHHFYRTSTHVHVRYMLSSVRLSVVCNVRAPYSGGSNFRQYFYGIRYLGHPLTSTENFTEIVPGGPLRLGS